MESERHPIKRDQAQHSGQRHKCIRSAQRSTDPTTRPRGAVMTLGHAPNGGSAAAERAIALENETSHFNRFLR